MQSTKLLQILYISPAVEKQVDRSGIVQACGGVEEGGHTHDSVAQAGSLLDTPEAAVDTPNYDPNFRGILSCPLPAVSGPKNTVGDISYQQASRNAEHAGTQILFLSCKNIFLYVFFNNFLKFFL